MQNHFGFMSEGDCWIRSITFFIYSLHLDMSETVHGCPGVQDLARIGPGRQVLTAVSSSLFFFKKKLSFYVFDVNS